MGANMQLNGIDTEPMFSPVNA